MKALDVLLRACGIRITPIEPDASEDHLDHYLADDDLPDAFTRQLAERAMATGKVQYGEVGDDGTLTITEGA